jgi:hypothetical protein
MSYKRLHGFVQEKDQIYEQLSKLDIAKKVPIKIDDGGVIKDVDNFIGIYNISKGEMCSAVTPAYNLVQHKQFFDMFGNSLDRLGLPYAMKV